MRELTQEFQKYVGMEVRNPNRMTCDWDTEFEEVLGQLRVLGYNPILAYEGKPQPPANVNIPNRVDVHLEEGADQKWRIAKFEPKP